MRDGDPPTGQGGPAFVERVDGHSLEGTVASTDACTGKRRCHWGILSYSDSDSARTTPPTHGATTQDGLLHGRSWFADGPPSTRTEPPAGRSFTRAGAHGWRWSWRCRVSSVSAAGRTAVLKTCR